MIPLLALSLLGLVGSALADSWGGPWVQGGAGLARRSGVQLGGELWLRGGLTNPNGVRVGAMIAQGAPRSLELAGEGRTLLPTHLVAGGWWAAEGAWAPYMGGTAGLALRSYRDVAGSSAWTATPVLGFEAGLELPLWRDLALCPYARVQGDLRGTELRVAGQPVQLLEPWEVQGGLGLLWRPRGPGG